MASFDIREQVEEIARKYGRLVKKELDVKYIFKTSMVFQCLSINLMIFFYSSFTEYH